MKGIAGKTQLTPVIHASALIPDLLRSRLSDFLDR